MAANENWDRQGMTDMDGFDRIAAQDRIEKAPNQGEAIEKKTGLLSGPMIMLLAAATTLTLAGAALSAFAVSSEPTMRAEDSSYETTSKAVLVRREMRRSMNRPFIVDSGATQSGVYIDRSQELDRSL